MQAPEGKKYIVPVNMYLPRSNEGYHQMHAEKADYASIKQCMGSMPLGNTRCSSLEELEVYTLSSS